MNTRPRKKRRLIATSLLEVSQPLKVLRKDVFATEIIQGKTTAAKASQTFDMPHQR